MARKRKPMKQIREILRLFELGFSLRKIARTVNISRPVVTDYIKSFQDKELKYEQITEISNSELAEQLGHSFLLKNEKYKLLEVSFPGYVRELTRTGVTLKLLWQEYMEQNPDGFSRSQFCYYFRKWKGSHKLSMPMDHKAGDKMFVDFTGKKMEIIARETGEIQELEIFVATLGASQKTFVCATASQKKADFILASRKALEYFGGVPAAVVPDCLKSAVTKGCKYEPAINQDYDDFAEHYGMAVLPARPYKPKDKAHVENSVKLAYQRIFAPLRNETFQSIAELNQAILPLLEKHNDSIMSLYDASRNQLFKEIEQKVLKPLPLTPFEIKESKIAKVAFNYHVFLGVDKHYYSVPHRYIGQKAKLRYNHSTVEVFVDYVRVAVHNRSGNKGKYTTNPDHMPAKHKWKENWNPDKLKNWAESMGPSVKLMIEELLKNARHEEQAYKSCLGILNIPKNKYSLYDLDLACQRALSYGQHSYKSVKNILQKNLHKQPLEADLFSNLPEHENLRGGHYYNLETTL